MANIIRVYPTRYRNSYSTRELVSKQDNKGNYERTINKRVLLVAGMFFTQAIIDMTIILIILYVFIVWLYSDTKKETL